MSRLLRALVGIVSLALIFVLGRWFWEKNTDSSATDVWFTTQSVNSDDEKAVRKESSNGKLQLIVFPDDKNAEPLWNDPATKEVKCPGHEWDISFSIPSHTDIKIYNKEWSEISTHGFSLSMIAQNNQVPGKLLKAILGKNPFDTDKCIYKTDDGKLVILSIRLSDEFTAVGPDGKSFLKQ